MPIYDVAECIHIGGRVEVEGIQYQPQDCNGDGFFSAMGDNVEIYKSGFKTGITTPADLLKKLKLDPNSRYKGEEFQMILRYQKLLSLASTAFLAALHRMTATEKNLQEVAALGEEMRAFCKANPNSYLAKNIWIGGAAERNRLAVELCRDAVDEMESFHSLPGDDERAVYVFEDRPLYLKTEGGNKVGPEENALDNTAFGLKNVIELAEELLMFRPGNLSGEDLEVVSRARRGITVYENEVARIYETIREQLDFMLPVKLLGLRDAGRCGAFRRERVAPQVPNIFGWTAGLGEAIPLRNERFAKVKDRGSAEMQNYYDLGMQVQTLDRMMESFKSKYPEFTKTFEPTLEQKIDAEKGCPVPAFTELALFLDKEELRLPITFYCDDTGLNDGCDWDSKPVTIQPILVPHPMSGTTPSCAGSTCVF